MCIGCYCNVVRTKSVYLSQSTILYQREISRSPSRELQVGSEISRRNTKPDRLVTKILAARKMRRAKHKEPTEFFH
jgi:hypothetical protein